MTQLMKLDAVQFDTKYDRLTQRLKDVLQMLVAGETDANISEKLNVQESSVRKYIERLCDAFDLITPFEQISDQPRTKGKGRRTKRTQLVALVTQYKPNLVPNLIQITGIYTGNQRNEDIIKETIQQVYHGNMSDFVVENSAYIEDILQEFRKEGKSDTLSDNELSILHQVAVNGEKISIDDIFDAVTDKDIDRDEIEFYVTSLCNKNKLKMVENDYILIPEIKEFIVNRSLARYLNRIGYEYYLRGDFHQAQKYFEDSINYYNESIKLPSLNHENHQFYPAIYNLASTCEKLELMGEAQKNYESICSHIEDKTKLKIRAVQAAISNYARLLILEGRLKDAEEQLQNPDYKNVIVDPVIKYSYNKNLAWLYLCYAKQAQDTRIKDIAEEKNSPDDLEGLEEVKDYLERAEKLLQEAIGLNQKRSIAHYIIAQVYSELAQVYVQEKNFKQAKKYLDLEKQEWKVAFDSDDSSSKRSTSDSNVKQGGWKPLEESMWYMMGRNKFPSSSKSRPSSLRGKNRIMS